MADGTTQPVAGTIVSENMLTTAGLTLKRGRWLDERRIREVVINETLARARFGDEDPVGQSIRLNANAGDFSVVGVVKDVRETIRSGSGMRFYAPATLGPPNISILLVRLDRDPGPEFAGLVRQAIYEEEPAITVHVVKSVHDLVDGQMWAERNAFTVLKGLATVALTLAMVGLFSVVIYTVESRSREFGVRMALGAMPSDLGRLVLRGALSMVGIGIAFGIVGALGLTRFMRSLLFETTPNDPVVYMMVTCLLLVSAALACWLPARRAANVDPVVALRME
jgi:putative ABC transport system permease protein